MMCDVLGTACYLRTFFLVSLYPTYSFKHMGNSVATFKHALYTDTHEVYLVCGVL